MVYKCETCGEEFTRNVIYIKHISKKACKQKDEVVVEEELTETQKLEKKVDNLEKRISELIDLIRDNMKITRRITNEMKPIKKERMDIDDSIAIDFLDQFSEDSDAELLYVYYLKNRSIQNYSIKCVKKNDYDFYNGESWITDRGGISIRDILSDNIKKLYTRLNNFNIDIDNQKYISRQEYINKMSSVKYKNRLMDLFTKKYLY